MTRLSSVESPIRPKISSYDDINGYLDDVIAGRWIISPKNDWPIVHYPTGRPYVTSADLNEDYRVWCYRAGFRPRDTFIKELGRAYPNAKTKQRVAQRMTTGFFFDLIY